METFPPRVVPAYALTPEQLDVERRAHLERRAARLEAILASLPPEDPRDLMDSFRWPNRQRSKDLGEERAA